MYYKKFSQAVIDSIGFYVYALQDPRDNRVFYVGKGKDERILQHVAEAGKNPKSEKAKLKRIQEIGYLLNWAMIGM